MKAERPSGTVTADVTVEMVVAVDRRLPAARRARFRLSVEGYLIATRQLATESPRRLPCGGLDQVHNLVECAAAQGLLPTGNGARLDASGDIA